MNYTLGVDLGTNSIGWSIIDKDNNAIIDAGVRIFDTTLSDTEKSRGASKNTERRNYRLRRRNLFRKRYRLTLLLKKLKEFEFIPNDLNISEFYKINPYEVRFKSLNEKISTIELSRIFYLFAKRRGFLSNRKGQQSKETKIDLTNIESSKVGINDNKRLADEYTTIGNYLYSIYKKDGEPYKYTDKIRNRILTRAIINDEFNLIWDKQKEYFPDILSDERKSIIGDFKKGIIFYQKPLKSQKHNLGFCPLEPTKRRCFISRPEFEEFRAWQFVNNVKLSNKELSINEKETMVTYLSEVSSNVKISQIKKKLKRENESCNYDDDETVVNMSTTYIIKNVLDKSFIKNISQDEFKNLKAVIWEKMNYFDSDDKLIKYFETLPINNDKLKLCTKPLKEGYGSYSLKAINNILPFLKSGHNLYKSVILGGIKNALGDKWNNENYEIITDFLNDIEEIFNLNYSIKERNELIKELTINSFNLNDKESKKLYFSADENKNYEILDKLPTPEEVKNPTVMKILNQLRKIINALIDKYGHPTNINIELARELKQTKEQRERTQKQNKINEKNRDSAKKFIESKGLVASDYLMQKYLLFKEIEDVHGTVLSPYTLKPISLSMLFSPDNIIQIEHIVPYSVSLDNSLANKTLCESDINALKGNRTPHKLFDGQNKWETIKKEVFKILPYQKATKFTREDIPELDTFISRQLNDTRYASKITSEYLKNICKNIQVSTGQITSKLRDLWGLNSLLGDEDNTKERGDHRHHALDAIVIAMINRRILNNISSNAYRNEERLRVTINLPWEDFRNAVKDRLEQILISHDFNEKILATSSKFIIHKGRLVKLSTIAARNTLHAETVYGKHIDPYDKQEYYYIRKNVAGLTPKQIQSIASPEIRSIIEQRIKNENIEVDKTKGIPDSFVYSIENNIKIPKLFLKNKRGDNVPIWKVRVKINSSNMRKLYFNNASFVEPANNHHVAVYKDQTEKIQFDYVTFWDAVNRFKNSLSVIDKNKYGSLINVFKINYTYIIGTTMEDLASNLNNKKWLSNKLFRGQKFSFNYFDFRWHIASTTKNDDEKISIRSVGAMLQKNPIRVHLDILGNIVKIYD